MGQSWVLDSNVEAFSLDEVDDVLARMWSVHIHVPITVQIQMGIAVGEIAGNIVEHAGPPTSVWVRMEARVGLNDVRVDFTDDGTPSSVDLARVCLPEDMSETGRGLALAQAVLDSLSYRRNGLNHWTLVSKPFG